MKRLSRRAWLATGLTAAAGLASARLAARYGLVPPDGGGLYGPGETLTYAAHRLISKNSLAREFPRQLISEKPFANPVEPLGEQFLRHQATGFAGWRLTVDGLVARPLSLSLSELDKFPQRSQVTEVACEEGWSYIAEWSGVPLAEVLQATGIQPQARFLVYASMQEGWWDSLDLDEALHPQTLVATGMNGGRLPVPFGGPLRLRVPRQLGYKSVKYITRLTVTDDIRKFGKGLGSAGPEFGYSWFAGI